MSAVTQGPQARLWKFKRCPLCGREAHYVNQITGEVIWDRKLWLTHMETLIGPEKEFCDKCGRKHETR